MQTKSNIERTRLLDSFLDALDEWDCPIEDRAEHIIDFIDGGYDLSEYKDRGMFRVIQGGRE
jgi:hypothetical protein